MATGENLSGANRCGDERGEEFQREQPQRIIKQPHQGGYDCQFVERPPKAVQSECPVCLLVLREPHQVTCCGCSFCATCVKRIQEGSKCCPTCNETDFNVLPNEGLKRSLYEFRVYCCQRGAGCDWVGELGELDMHLNLQPPPEKLLVGCQFSEVDCTYCVQLFQRRYVQAHQSDDCPKRPFACQHCKQHEATWEEVTQTHWPVCPFFPLSCPNKCELMLQRQEVEHHVSQNCPRTLVQCDFHMVGCQVQLPRRDMPSHVSENLTRHMSLLQVHMTTHPGENMATYLCLVVGSIQKVVLDNTNIRTELHKAQTSLAEQERKLAEQERKQLESEANLVHKLNASEEKLQATLNSNRKLQQSLAEQERKYEAKLRTVKDDLTRKITASEQKIQTQETTLDQHQKTLENMTCTGILPFECTMTEFEKKRRAKDEWYSPPFYTHTHGYKMCIRVDAYGFGSGKGTHVSISTYIMRGLFDGDLKWPFRGDVTVQIVNQAGEDNHQEKVISYADKTPDGNAGRVTDEELSEGWGKSQFLPHSSLGYSAVRKSQYLREDSLQIRVSKVKLKN